MPVTTKRVAKRYSKKSPTIDELDVTAEGFPKSGPELTLFLRERLIEVTKGIANKLSEDALRWLHSLVEARVQASLNNPCFLPFGMKFDDSNYSWRLQRIHEKNSEPCIASGVAASSLAMFGEVEIPAGDPLLNVDGEFDIVKGKWPTGRHIFFAMQQCMVFMQFRCDYVEYTFDKHEVPKDLEGFLVNGKLTLTWEIESWREVMNSGQWNPVTIVGGYVHRSHRARLSVHSMGTVTEGYVDTHYANVSGYSPNVLTVEQALGTNADLNAKLDSQISGIEYSILPETNPDIIPGGATLNLGLLTGVLIEGLHWNKHRRSEIEHLLIQSETKTRRQLIVETLGGSHDNGSLELLQVTGFDNMLSMNPFVSSDMDEMVTGLRMRNSIIALTSAEGAVLVNAISKEYEPSEATIREAAIRVAADRYELDYAAKLSSLDSARNRLIQAENKVMEAHFILTNFKKDIGNFLDSLYQRVAELDIIEKIMLAPDFTLYLQTKPLFANAISDRVEAASKADQLPSEKVRRYMGVYQIAYNGLTGDMSVRNVAAPMGVIYSDRHCNQRASSELSWAFPAFHPHSSRNGRGETLTTSVCLGGYDSQLSATTRLEQYDRVETSMKRIHAMLLFLQEYTLGDTYVNSLMYVFPTNIPSITGVTAWQNVAEARANRSDRITRSRMSVFDIPMDFKSPNLPLFTAAFTWPKFVDLGDLYDQYGDDEEADEDEHGDPSDREPKFDFAGCDMNVTRYGVSYLQIEALVPKVVPKSDVPDNKKADVFTPYNVKLEPKDEKMRLGLMKSLSAVHSANTDKEASA